MAEKEKCKAEFDSKKQKDVSLKQEMERTNKKRNDTIKVGLILVFIVVGVLSKSVEIESDTENFIYFIYFHVPRCKFDILAF